jgi:hypothetical protein
MGGEEGRWIKGSLVLFPFFPYFSNFFCLLFNPSSRFMERGANGGFDFEKQGQTCKVKKRGANKQLDLKTGAVLR